MPLIEGEMNSRDLSLALAVIASLGSRSGRVSVVQRWPGVLALVAALAGAVHGRVHDLRVAARLQDAGYCRNFSD